MVQVSGCWTVGKNVARMIIMIETMCTGLERGVIDIGLLVGHGLLLGLCIWCKNTIH